MHNAHFVQRFERIDALLDGEYLRMTQALQLASRRDKQPKKDQNLVFR